MTTIEQWILALGVGLAGLIAGFVIGYLLARYFFQAQDPNKLKYPTNGKVVLHESEDIDNPIMRAWSK